METFWKHQRIIFTTATDCCRTDSLSNVTITAAKGFEIHNAKGIELKNVSVRVANGNRFNLENAEVSGLAGSE